MNKVIICLLCLLTMISVLSVQAYAEDSAPDNWELETENLPQEEQDRYLKDIRWMFSNSMQPLGLIHCYAAAVDGSVAIGLNEGETMSVHVLDAQGGHLYTVKFAPSSSYSLGWRQADHTLLIYIFRGDRLVSVGPDRSVSVHNLFSTSDNYRLVHELFSRKQSIGNCRYSLENPFGIFNFLLVPDFCRLVATEGNETKILYEADNNRVHDKLIESVGIVIVFIAAAVWLYINIRGIVKRKRTERQLHC